MFSDYTSNFLIYYNNLSTYYILCVFLSITAVILSWICHFKNVETEEFCEKTVIEDGAETNQTNEYETILTTFKQTRKQTIENIAANLTKDQMIEEKEAEREQLAAILQLLKEQEDKFQVASMEELEGQLKLYRI